jgi:hypothetical protein
MSPLATGTTEAASKEVAAVSSRDDVKWCGGVMVVLVNMEKVR